MEHILRAAADLTKRTRFVIVGSAAVVVRVRNVPADMMMTPEIDIYVPDAADADEIADLIDSNIGRNSPFHQTYGYFGDGVSPQTAKMPADWQERVSEYNGVECPGVTLIVPEENDIAMAKVLAWRDKDLGWLKAGLNHKLLDLQAMADRLHLMPDPDPERGIPGHEELARRLVILGTLCKVAVTIPDQPTQPGVR